MTKKIAVMPAPDQPLVSADVVAADTGFSVQYIRRVAAEKKIPSYGLKNGSRVFRRYVVSEVREALRKIAS